MMTPEHPTPEPLTYTEADWLQEEFVSQGLVVLPPEALGIPADVHADIYTRQKDIAKERHKAVSDSMLAELVPQILDVLNAPGLIAACDQILGERYAIAPFTHNGMFPSGGQAQHWHKDDCAPLNARKQRHHQAVQAVLLYYPQEVGPEMGPTTMMTFSQY